MNERNKSSNVKLLLNVKQFNAFAKITVLAYMQCVCCVIDSSVHRTIKTFYKQKPTHASLFQPFHCDKRCSWFATVLR